MLLNIQNAQLNEGKPVKVNVQVELDKNLLSDKGYSFVGPVNVEGTMTYEFESVKILLKADCKLNVVCDACGEPFVQEIKFDIDETFSKSASEFNNYYEMSSVAIDIERPLVDNLFINLPSKMLCKPDCKGLCKYCGKNLNFQSCNCEEIERELENQDNPFYKLKNLDKNN